MRFLKAPGLYSVVRKGHKAKAKQANGDYYLLVTEETSGKSIKTQVEAVIKGLGLRAETGVPRSCFYTEILPIALKMIAPKI